MTTRERYDEVFKSFEDIIDKARDLGVIEITFMLDQIEWDILNIGIKDKLMSPCIVQIKDYEDIRGADRFQYVYCGMMINCIKNK